MLELKKFSNAYNKHIVVIVALISTGTQITHGMT